MPRSLIFSLACLLSIHADRLPAAGPASATANVPSRPQGAAAPMAGMGIMTGELTESSVLVQVRLTTIDRPVDGDVPGAWGVVRYQISLADEPANPIQTQSWHALPQRDFITRAHFGSLRANTAYVCKTTFAATMDQLDQDDAMSGPTATFKTLPGADSDDEVSFVVVTGMNYAKFHGDNRIDRAQHRIENNSDLPEPYAGADKALGYPALQTIRQMQPDFFVGTGDNVYYDTPDDPRATTIKAMRRKWHEQFVQSRYKQLFASVPTYWEVDDHDYRIDDGDNAGEFLPLPETARRILLEQLPYAPTTDPAPLTYRTVRLNRDTQIWLTENRMYRSPNAMDDGPGKTIWGERQKQWLMKTLVDSDARRKIVISPTPMVGPDDLRKTDNHCDIGGFQHERDEFFQFLKNNDMVDSVALVCGDRHWQYHALHPSGISEYSCGALIDSNSRLARMPGDPKGTDPDGLIKHLHVQEKASGGFLLVRSTSGKLSFEFCDENGQLLYEDDF